MPYGLQSTEEQLAALRAESELGVAIAHVDTCLSSFLTDHHNRNSECLFGVYVDGSTSAHDVLTGLLDEMRATADRVPEAISWDTMKGCAKSWFADAYGTSPEALAKPFDPSLETIDGQDRESYSDDQDRDSYDVDMGESCQAWFVLTWNVEGGDTD